MGSFKTKARAIELLGRKQIRDGVTAIAELMKNSYDAYAYWVRAEFVTEHDNPYILLCDNGHGMSSDDIENKWLVLGTDSKYGKKVKKIETERVLMGAKGIGRLAAARLGQQMWLLSKTVNTNWNILYLNWNIFENPDLLIEQVTIPSLYDISLADLKNNYKEIMSTMKADQLKNLDIQLWTYPKDGKRLFKPGLSDTYELCSKQVKNVEIPFEHILHTCSTLEEDQLSQGTIILIQDLREDWSRYLKPGLRPKDKMSSDIIAYKNYTRLSAFVSNFKHADKNFTVEVLYNNQVLEFNSDYTDEDYEIYDLKIEGEVREGKFFGKLSARNADEKILSECNEDLKKGLELTSGLGNWQKSDCGPYSVKLCHIEMEQKSSGLTNEEYSRITKKMETSGGIGVFRDGVRILPYGEPENDFLNLEERRSKNAGLYLFAHRNIFGRIDINSNDNPLLEDKSSREGLIENEQFHFFIRTLENLLIRIATEYVASRGKKSSKGLRDTYVNYNRKLADEKKQKDEAEKHEEKLAKKAIRTTKSLLTINKEKFLRSKERILLFINNWENMASNLKPNDGYLKLSEMLQEFREERDENKRQINSIYEELYIGIPARFSSSYDEKLREHVSDFNIWLETEFELLKNDFENRATYVEHSLQNSITRWKEIAEKHLAGNPDAYEKIINARSLEILTFINNTIQDLNTYIESKGNDLRHRMKPLLDKVVYVEEVERELKQVISNNGLNTIKREVDELRSQILRLKTLPPFMVSEQGKTITSSLERIEKKVHEYAENVKSQANEKFSSLLPSIQSILSYLESESEGSSVNYLLGSLKQKNLELENQLDLYSDLANLGLSAEIVSHEFNQLFINVNDAIKQLKVMKQSNDAFYWIRQIEIGFRAISDRQSQLSPMYRSYNLPKKMVKLKALINDIRNFYLPTLNSNNIELVNDIDESTEIVLSLSKIYPVLSNLIHNSIYWVLDRDIKQILFHFNDYENALYIEDTGPGIPAKYSSRIFEPFFSLKPGGRGLGLAITKRVLESQGHEIQVVLDSSSKILNGACFRIVFSNSDESKSERSTS